MDLPIPTRGHKRYRFKNFLSILNPGKIPYSHPYAETFLTGGTCLPAFACGETPPSCSFSKLFSKPTLQQIKTNPAPDKPLALKSRGVVEFTTNEGWVTRNKSSSPVFW